MSKCYSEEYIDDTEINTGRKDNDLFIYHYRFSVASPTVNNWKSVTSSIINTSRINLLRVNGRFIRTINGASNPVIFFSIEPSYPYYSDVTFSTTGFIYDIVYSGTITNLVLDFEYTKIA